MENNIEIHIDNENQYNTENSVENFSENTVKLNNETTDKKSLIEDFIKLITQKLQPNKINTQLEQSKEEVNEEKNEQQLENNIQSNNLDKQKEEILVIDRFEDGFAVCENRLYGIIKADGSYLVKPKYKDIDKFTYGFAIVKAENYKEGLIDLNGYEIIPTVYDTINIINEKYVVVRQNFKEGLLETNGKMRLPVIYESVGENIVDDMVQVQLCGYLGIAKLMD